MLEGIAGGDGLAGFGFGSTGFVGFGFGFFAFGLDGFGAFAEVSFTGPG